MFAQSFSKPNQSLSHRTHTLNNKSYLTIYFVDQYIAHHILENFTVNVSTRKVKLYVQKPNHLKNNTLNIWSVWVQLCINVSHTKH